MRSCARSDRKSQSTTSSAPHALMMSTADCGATTCGGKHTLRRQPRIALIVRSNHGIRTPSITPTMRWSIRIRRSERLLSTRSTDFKEPRSLTQCQPDIGSERTCPDRIIRAKIPAFDKEPQVKLMLLIVPVLLLSGCIIVPMNDSGSKTAGGTVQVCHKGKKTLELPQSAEQAHLNHGDRLGPC